MFLRYIYIEKYNDIITKKDINLKWKYNFEFSNKKLFATINENYLYNFYDDYNNLDDLTAIIGKNTSGKSSILRCLNEIISKMCNKNYHIEEDFNFIVIFSDNNNIYLYDNMKYSIEVTNFKIIKENIKNIKINLEDDKDNILDINDKFNLQNTKIIYYSGIFDKNKALNETKVFMDISTNNMVRKSIEETYYLKMSRWRKISNNDNNKIDLNYSAKMEYETEQFDFIDEFRKKELIRKIKYYNTLIQRNRGEEKKLLFSFPSKLYISFADNFNIKDEFISNLINYNNKDKEVIKGFIELIEKFTLHSGYDYEKLISKQDNFIIQFSLLIYYELIETLIKVLDCDIVWNLEELLLKLSTDTISPDIIKYYISKLKTVKIFYEEELYENFTKINVEKDTSLQRIKSIITILDKEINEDSFIEEQSINSELIQEYNKNSMVNDKCNFILTIVQDILDKIKSIFIEEASIIDDLTKINVYTNISMDDIDKKVNNRLDEIIIDIDYLLPREDKYYIDDNQKNYQVLNFKELLYDNNFESDLLMEFCYELREKLFILFEIIDTISLNRYLKNENFVKGESKFYYSKANYEVIKEVNKYLDIIDKWTCVVKKNESNLNKEDQYYLECSWEDTEVLEFIKNYDKLNITTFKIEYESEMLSSGQVVYFELQYRLFDIINEIKDSDIILLIDEADIYMHPGVQISFIENILEFIEKFLGNKVQIILTSNSPFIISDIPNSKIIYIERNDLLNIKEGNDISKIRTLGTPINDLLINTFFMDEGIVGKIAQKKIDQLIKILYKDDKNNILNMNDKEREKLYNLIDSIGDTIIRYKLMSQYNNIIKKDTELVEKQIQIYRKMIKQLELGK